MSDFINIIKEYLPAIIGGGVAVFSAVCSYLVARLSTKNYKAKIASLNQQLSEARNRKTYTSCPHCGEKIYLDQISWHLPSGELDNNLNGVPDDAESSAPMN